MQRRVQIPFHIFQIGRKLHLWWYTLLVNPQGKKHSLIYCWQECEWTPSYGRQFGNIHQKFKFIYLLTQEFTVSGKLFYRYTCMHAKWWWYQVIHCNFVCSSWRLETTQISINRSWLNKLWFGFTMEFIAVEWNMESTYEQAWRDC